MKIELDLHMAMPICHFCGNRLTFEGYPVIDKHNGIETILVRVTCPKCKTNGDVRIHFHHGGIHDVQN